MKLQLMMSIAQVLLLILPLEVAEDRNDKESYDGRRTKIVNVSFLTLFACIEAHTQGSLDF